MDISNAQFVAVVWRVLTRRVFVALLAFLVPVAVTYLGVRWGTRRRAPGRLVRALVLVLAVLSAVMGVRLIGVAAPSALSLPWPLLVWMLGWGSLWQAARVCAVLCEDDWWRPRLKALAFLFGHLLGRAAVCG